MSPCNEAFPDFQYFFQGVSWPSLSSCLTLGFPWSLGDILRGTTQVILATSTLWAEEGLGTPKPCPLDFQPAWCQLRAGRNVSAPGWRNRWAGWAPMPSVHRLFLPPRVSRAYMQAQGLWFGHQSSPGLPFTARWTSPVAFWGYSSIKKLPAFSCTSDVRYKPHREKCGHAKGRFIQHCLGRRGLLTQFPARLL